MNTSRVQQLSLLSLLLLLLAWLVIIEPANSAFGAAIISYRRATSNNDGRINKPTRWANGGSGAKAEEEEVESSASASASLLSDEELLLACRAYLQKKNRLGEWTEAKKRKENRQRQQKLAKGSHMGGFFWDDPTELKYYRSPSSMNYNRFVGTSKNLGEENNRKDDDKDYDYYDDDDYIDIDSEEEEEMEDEQLQSIAFSSSKNTMSASRLEQVAFDFPNDSDSSSQLEQWSKEFSSFPSEPSETKRKQSQSMRKKWQDPQWKAKWYENRWGKHNNNKKKKKGKENQEKRKSTPKETNTIKQDEATPHQQKTLSRHQVQAAAALSVEFLASPEFNELSEEEISKAVTMYSNANAKRAASLKQAHQERRAWLNNDNHNQQQSRVPLNALSWDRDPEALREAQRARSEKARKAYQQRLKNSQAAADATKKKKEKSSSDATTIPNKRQRPLPRGITTKDALLRIESDLDHGKIPQVRDLQLIAAPSRLAKRKELLRRILLECFGLRGKCVPISVGGGDDDTKLEFITTCSVHQLINFVIATIRQQNNNNDDQVEDSMR